MARKKKTEDEVSDLEIVVAPTEEDLKSAKKVKPKKQAAVPEAPAKFNLFEKSAQLKAQTNESLLAIAARQKKNALVFNMMSLADTKAQCIPMRHIGLQLLMGARGWISKTLLEIIGAEGIGKSTFLLDILGQCMMNQSPCLLVNSESKNLNQFRQRRALHHDEFIAYQLQDALETINLYELRLTIKFIETWVKIKREDSCVPKDIPLVVGVDTLSKLMSPGEAAGHYKQAVYQSAEALKKAKDTGESSNLEFSKLMHAWCRRLPCWLDDNNVFLILVSHQNQKVSMSSFMPTFGGEGGAGLNKTKIGGNASNQNALAQLTLKNVGMIKNSANEVIGNDIVGRVVKNTGGPTHKELKWQINTKTNQDISESEMQRALSFDEGTAQFMADNNIFGTTVSKKRYSSEILEVQGMTAEEYIDAVHARPDLIEKLGVAMEMTGFDKPPKVSAPTVEVISKIKANKLKLDDIVDQAVADLVAEDKNLQARQSKVADTTVGAQDEDTDDQPTDEEYGNYGEETDQA